MSINPALSNSSRSVFSLQDYALRIPGFAKLRDLISTKERPEFVELVGEAKRSIEERRPVLAKWIPDRDASVLALEIADVVLSVQAAAVNKAERQIAFALLDPVSISFARTISSVDEFSAVKMATCLRATASDVALDALFDASAHFIKCKQEGTGARILKVIAEHPGDYAEILLADKLDDATDEKVTNGISGALASRYARERRQRNELGQEPSPGRKILYDVINDALECMETFPPNFDLLQTRVNAASRALLESDCGPLDGNLLALVLEHSQVSDVTRKSILDYLKTESDISNSLSLIANSGMQVALGRISSSPSIGKHLRELARDLAVR